MPIREILLGARSLGLAIFMSPIYTQAKEILIDEKLTDYELGEIVDACEELADIFIEELIDNKNNYGSQI